VRSTRFARRAKSNEYFDVASLGPLSEARNRLRTKSNFASRFKLIRVVQIRIEKYFTSVFQKFMIVCRRPASA